MDCTDLVIGMARGNYSRIGDYYTRDRSTPQLDGFYGGRQDLTAALGYERDGQTVILFRRKLNGSFILPFSTFNCQSYVYVIALFYLFIQ